MSVIIGRALPDVRDGLKPVHRRVLFAMHDLSNSYNRPYKKSARIVGDVIGKYHPHGDQAVYDTLVRMAQTFSMRHVLVDGQGNFGSVDGDPPAAMRYTEVRMAKLASELLADIDKETVDFGSNYDDTLQEPLVLPTRFPNLLVNGSAGIAVGMATNIPPHNLSEVIDGTIALAKSPQLSTADLMNHIPAPDFPTAGFIYGTDTLRQAYETGRGVIRLRAKAEIETWKNGDRERIVVTEIPYQVNKATLLEKIADLVRDKRVEGISDIRDESDRDGMRVVVDIKRDANAEIILNQLYTLTQLQTSFGINLLAIVSGRPVILSLKELLQHFIDHRRDVVTRRSRFELREAQKRFNVVFGLLAAIDSIDRIIEIIRSSRDQPEARERLMSEQLTMGEAFKTLCQRLLTFDFPQGREAVSSGFTHLNERQAQAILDMRLARLTGLERDKLEKEAEELRDTIEHLTAILSSHQRLMEVIVEELEAVKAEYGQPRRTNLVADARQMSAEDLIAEEDMVVTISHAGYVKRNPVTIYRSQKRGGRGITATTTRSQDFVSNLFVASTHSYVLVFSDLGKVYALKVHEIPQGGRTARGKPILNLLRFAKNERLAAVLPVRDFEDGKFVVMCTAKGIIKKTELQAFANTRTSGLIALSIDEDDRLINVAVTDGERDILVATKQGMAIRFPEDQVRAMGRSARGVRAITLKREGDEVVGMVILTDATPELLTITNTGRGKRSPLAEYRLQGRLGMGIINIKLDDDSHVAGISPVADEDQVMVLTDGGMMIRTSVEQISVQGRSAKGVRVITLNEGEHVASVARIAEREDQNGNGDSNDRGSTEQVSDSPSTDASEESSDS
jgi:DNA gyrase subunit A